MGETPAQGWYIKTGDAIHGPIDSATLKQLADSGKISLATPIRKGESGNWFIAKKVRGLFSETQIAASLVDASEDYVLAEPCQRITPPPSPPPRPPIPPPVTTNNKKKPKLARLTTWAAIVAGSQALLLLLCVVMFRGSATQHAENDQRHESSQSTANESRVIRDPATLYENSRIAVATISTKDSEGYDSGQGSGFFINISQVEQFTPRRFDTNNENGKWERSGYILTNYHVIREAASAKVHVHDFGVHLDAHIDKVIMEREDLDLALLSVQLWPPKREKSPNKEADGFRGFIDQWDWGLAESKIPWWKSSVPTLEIADREDPAVGMKVYAIGSPQGLDATLSEGIVSGYRSGSEGLPRLQFSAPVSPGSSGGPLVDETGQVVGVVTALYRRGQNLNFAVPASEVRDFLNGKCNSRELWRGTSIDDELQVALYPVNSAMRRAEGRKQDELATIRIVVAVDIVANTTASQYREWWKTLLGIEPSSCGDFEYLLYYARGEAGIRVANLDIHENFAALVAKSEQGLPAIEIVRRQLQQSPDHQAGIRFLKHSIQLNPKFPPSHNSLYHALSITERHAEALLAADRLVQLVPRCSKAFRARGSAYESLEQFNSALQDYQTAADLSPKNPANYFELGNIYAKLSEHDKAIESFEASLSLSKHDSGETCMRLAFSLQKAGRFPEAIVRFQEARADFLANRVQTLADLCDEAIAECRAKKRP